MTIGAGGVSPVAGGAQGDYPQYHGIYYGSVSGNADPTKKNRCTLRVPQLLGSGTTTWAMPLTPLVDPPKVGTLVSVMFSGGDLDNPVYLVVTPAVPIESDSANVQAIGTANSAGVSHKVAAADHVHAGIDTNAAHLSPVSAGATASAGTQPLASRMDHVHAAPNLVPLNASSTITGNVTVNGTLATSGANEISCGGQLLVGGNAFVTGQSSFTGTAFFTDVVINPAPSNPTGGNTSYSIAGQNTSTTDGNTGSTWATGERDYINNLVDSVDILFSAFNALQSSFDSLYGTVDAMYTNLYS